MTIELRDVSKSYPTSHGLASILKNVNLTVDPGEHVGILGQNGAGKSTLIRILSGSERPTSGEIRQKMSVSWPLAFGGAFLGGLTGIDNIRFVCRLYGVDPVEKMPFIDEFTELGKYLREPVRTYSSGMRARLAFGVSMAIDFDCYLIDEIVAVGDDRFQRKCRFELFEKRRDRALLIVSHSADFVRQYCQRASVLSSGVLTNFSTIDEAYAYYAAHEVPIQPHMAAYDAEPAPHLTHDTIDHLSEKYAELGPGPDFEAVLERAKLDRVPVFDSCDVIGRLASSGNMEAAMQIAEFLTRRVPSETLFWVTLGDLLCGQRQHVPGVDAYQTALRLDPDSYWANRNLATEHFNVGRYVEAIPHYDRALRLVPHDSASLELQLRLVDCYFLLDRVSEFQPPSELPDGELLVVDRHSTATRDGGVARFSVSGLRLPSTSNQDLRCVFIVGNERIEGSATYARSSIRRLAAVVDREAFSFNAYAPIPASVASFEIELWSGDRKVYGSVHQIQFMSRTRDLPEDDVLAAARYANSLHDADLSLIYYGLSDRSGLGSDIIPFAENLIAQGHYDEAEYRLSQWLREASDDAADRGFVIDQLCAEIARTRLPGWQEEIHQILSNEASGAARASVEANAGHAAVARGDLPSAIDLYEAASQKIGARPLIHFARGVHSARFAGQVTPPHDRPSDGHEDRAAGIVHLFACDGNYFVRFAEKLVESSIAARRGTALQVHAHIVDANEAAVALAEDLQASHGLAVTYESSPKFIRDDNVRRAYFTCARFLQAPKLIREYRRPVLITETDCLINWHWPDLLGHVGKADVGYLQSALWNWVPWTKVPAGIYLLTPSPAGLALSDYIARFIDHAFQSGGDGSVDLWTVDQVALWLAHMNSPAEAKSVHLPMSSVLTLATGDKLNI